MKYRAILVLLLISLSAAAQKPDFLSGIGCKMLSNERYGAAKRNVFDIIMPKSGQPTALVVYIHGGGFLWGDKQEAYERRKEDIAYFLQHNIAFATISYQFYKSDDSLGVGRCLNDVKRAIQYIRHNASKYNIDKQRIGSYGISAGAGSSLYLAFHDDFAIKGDSTLLGESTRLRCVGAISTQATYNLFRWFDFIPNLGMVAWLKKKQFYSSMANFYGYPTYNGFKPLIDSIPKQYDMLRMISPDDPPVYVINMQKKRFPKDFDIIEHHRGHAMVLSKELAKKNVRHYMYIYSKKTKLEQDVSYSVKEFMVDNLK
ncbi:alpha/beta hydrolase [uncultured Acetobacteroides sp.]|uniref:alpha/beta hydrolase n=1 Tax=uncultured Acetobacteroides sp. TaxID=1760811 RepID=UPI0029F47E26|nr:alpha/beta hydrolase [uncultured Acetobacteroides sp.]